jgi:hypothetical protein
MALCRDDSRLLSRPHRVHFAGFESSTYRLQQAGWQLSAEQSPRDGRLGLVMRHQGAGCYMMADEVRFNFMSSLRSEQEYELDFQVRRCSSDITVIQSNMGFGGFEPIDATPQFVTTERKSIKDFNIFASQLVRTEEIIIEPQSVAECLDLIRKMQAPELAAVRKRNLDRDRMDPINQQNFHAQIVSLAA